MRLPLISELLYYFKVYYSYTRWRFFLFIALTFMGSISEIIGISLFIPLLDKAGLAGKLPGYCKYLYYGLDFLHIPTTFIALAIVIVLLIWLKGVFVWNQRRVQGKILSQLMDRMRVEAVEKFSKVNYEYYTSRNTGYFNNVVCVEAPKAASSFTQYSSAIACIMNIALYTCGVFLINLPAALAAFAFGAVFLFAFKFIYHYSRKYSHLTSKKLAHLQNLMIQSVTSFKYLKSTSRFDSIGKQVKNEAGELAGCYFNQAMIAALIEAISEPVAVSGAILYILVCYYSGEAMVSAGPVLFLIYRTVRQVSGFQNMWQKFNANCGGIDTYISACKDFETHKESEGKKIFEEIKNVIALRNVSFAYGETKALENINFEIPRNNSVAFVGDSGSGKTSLINIITGMIKPQSGTICADSTDYRDIEISSLRKKMGYVSQENVVFNDSVAFNITLEYPENGSSQWIDMQEAARKANAEEFISKMPEEYNTFIGDRGITLSGGQRQRLHIARELYHKPLILILDEATSSLDSESEHLIQKSIDALKGSLTTIIIAHRLSTIKNADMIYVMDKGRIIEEGSYKSLSSNRESRFYKMLEYQKLTEKAS